MNGIEIAIYSPNGEDLDSLRMMFIINDMPETALKCN